MVLVYILGILVLGALLSSMLSKFNNKLPYWIAIVSQIVALFLLSLYIPDLKPGGFRPLQWIDQVNIAWIPVLGANFHLAIDGFSFILIALTLFLTIVGTIVSKHLENQGFYFFNILMLASGVVGIFIAIDLLLFFFFWEMMLVPMYFIIARYQSDNAEKVSFKFLIYTQLSGLFMLVSILTLFFIHGRQTGIYTFELSDLLNTSLPLPWATILMLGFLAAFLVKLAVIPFHGWMPSVFRGSPVLILLTGVLIKTGAYGIMRFSIPLFPDSSSMFAPTALAIGVITVLYAGFIAFSSNDIRNIVAYSAISHTGFILIGIFSFQLMAWQGVLLQMIASALSSAGLIILAELLYQRTGTYDITQMSGLWEKVPVLSGFGLFFAIASLGLPGLANFLAEFLILAGTFKVSILVTLLASIGIVIAAAYSLRIVQKVFVGPFQSSNQLKELNWRENLALALLLVCLLTFGLYAKPITSTTNSVFENLLEPKQTIDTPIDNPNADEAKVQLKFINLKY